MMKTRHPQIAQITQTVKVEEAPGGCKEYNGRFFGGLPNLCNLRNLRTMKASYAGSADIVSASTLVATQPAGKMPALPAYNLRNLRIKIKGRL